MDPDANLEEQSKLAMHLYACYEQDADIEPDDVARLCELVEAMDGWMTKGGSLPRKWQGDR